MKKVFIIAGEASGDLHGAGLMRAMKSLRPEVEFLGIGGSQMVEAGLHPVFLNNELAVVGLFEIMSHVRPILKAVRQAMHALKQERPNLLVLIDYPGLNLFMARYARHLGIPVFYYISPQVWAWRRGRIKKMRRLIDKLAVILPFEEDFFRSNGLNAHFVGHPLLDVVRPSMSREAFCESAGLVPGRDIVGILPGSRRGEVQRMLPIFLQTAALIQHDLPKCQFVLPVAPSLSRTWVEECIARERQANPRIPEISIVERQAYDAMAASSLLLLASGTVTLEAAILRIPMLVAYRVSGMTYQLARRIVHVKFMSLVNLIADREIVPEFLQHEATPERLSEAGLFLLKDKKRRQDMLNGLNEVVSQLKVGGQGQEGAAMQAARLALDMLLQSP
jgi:lipid-A-disaccharide synthase